MVHIPPHTTTTYFFPCLFYLNDSIIKYNIRQMIKYRDIFIENDHSSIEVN